MPYCNSYFGHSQEIQFEIIFPDTPLCIRLPYLPKAVYLPEPVDEFPRISRCFARTTSTYHSTVGQVAKPKVLVSSKPGVSVVKEPSLPAVDKPEVIPFKSTAVTVTLPSIILTQMTTKPADDKDNLKKYDVYRDFVNPEGYVDEATVISGLDTVYSSNYSHQVGKPSTCDAVKAD